MDRACLLPASEQSLNAAVAPTEGDRNRKRCSGVAVLGHSVFPSGAPRKNRTWGTRHLAGPTRDVGSAGRRESFSGGLRMYGVGEA